MTPKHARHEVNKYKEYEMDNIHLAWRNRYNLKMIFDVSGLQTII